MLTFAYKVGGEVKENAYIRGCPQMISDFREGGRFSKKPFKMLNK